MTDKVSPYTITLDDDPDIHKIIARMTGIQSLPFKSPEKLLARADSFAPIAVFIDINLDVGVNGLDYVSAFRKAWPLTPILVVTSTLEGDCVGKALALGANDFIRKPLLKDELCARLSTRLVEMQEKRGDVQQQLNDLLFNPRLGTLQKGEHVCNLAPLECRLLLFLAQQAGITTTKDAIRQHVWGDTKTCDNALDKKLSNLRKALRECRSAVQIVTAYGGLVTLQLYPESVAA